METAHTLFKLAEQQAGYFTAMQAREVGYDYPHQYYHKVQGHWLDMGWGLYRLRDYPQAPDENLVRLSLWSRNKQGEVQGVFSHQTALRLHELSDVLPGVTHMTVPKGFRKTPLKGLRLYKAKLESNDWETRGAYRLTTPLRTLFDAAESALSPEHLERAAQEVLERGMVRRRRLQDALSTLSPEAKARLLAALETT